MVLTACSHLPPQLAFASFINLRRVKSNKPMAFRSRRDCQLLSDVQIIVFKLSFVDMGSAVCCWPQFEVPPPVICSLARVGALLISPADSPALRCSGLLTDVPTAVSGWK